MIHKKFDNLHNTTKITINNLNNSQYNAIIITNKTQKNIYI